MTIDIVVYYLILAIYHVINIDKNFYNVLILALLLMSHVMLAAQNQWGIF